MNNFDKFATAVVLVLIGLLVTMCIAPTAKANGTVCMNLNVTVQVQAAYPQYWDKNGVTCDPRTAEKSTMCLLRGWSVNYLYNNKRKSTIIMGSQRPGGTITVMENVCMTRDSR